MSHVVHYFHQADDPYSALLASVLPRLQARYRRMAHARATGPIVAVVTRWRWLAVWSFFW